MCHQMYSGTFDDTFNDTFDDTFNDTFDDTYTHITHNTHNEAHLFYAKLTMPLLGLVGSANSL